MATFESQNRRMPKIEACLKANGLESLDACNEMLLAKGIDCDKIIRGIQPICFDNAVWAYTLGTAIAVKRGLKSAADCAAALLEELESSFTCLEWLIARINLTNCAVKVEGRSLTELIARRDICAYNVVHCDASFRISDADGIEKILKFQ